MTHLKMQETKKDQESRREWKLRLIRRLYERGYNKSDIINLFRFIDWVMVLPKGLESSFWTELKAYEETRKVPYITSVERLGFERGLQEGRQEGRQEGLQEGRQEGLQEASRLILQRLLVGKFGTLPEHLCTAVETLSPEAVESLAIALLNFSSIEDLETWLAEQRLQG
ncbi:MAG: hypothetical protein HLUCCA11_17795 [Phormidesmis priestleyi Ana]|uniref:DUF4351 domain-containing protein n=1 Tax=Phormidesmis priestleyi Ana TaxID=1666911 RepID=A0A0P7ZTL8_9CYAN|nr:MAG: hypothetical protein HLUCCA11_17795 [Phormidesmis priestleyi Ana]